MSIPSDRDIENSDQFAGISSVTITTDQGPRQEVSGKIRLPYAAHFPLHPLPGQLLQELHHSQEIHEPEQGPPCGLPYEGIRRSCVRPGQRHLADPCSAPQDDPGLALWALYMEELEPLSSEGMERVRYLNKLCTV